jgi:hypothetical protein
MLRLKKPSNPLDRISLQVLKAATATRPTFRASL